MFTLESRLKPSRCEWCGREIQSASTQGRKKRYCQQSCRQRAYEQRQKLKSTDIPEDSVILTASQYTDLLDNLYELRCAAEDVDTAVREGGNYTDIASLTLDVVNLAKKLEKIRGD